MCVASCHHLSEVTSSLLHDWWHHWPPFDITGECAHLDSEFWRRRQTCQFSRNHHLTMVEGFQCPNESRSYVVGACLPLNEDQTKCGNKILLWWRPPRTCLGLGECLVPRPLSMGSSPAQPERKTRLHPHVVWPHTTHRSSHRGLVLCGSGGSQRQVPWQSNPQLLKLIGTRTVTSLMGEGTGACGLRVKGYFPVH